MPKFPTPPAQSPFNMKGSNARVRPAGGSPATTDEEPNTIVSRPWTQWFNAVQKQLSPVATLDLTNLTGAIVGATLLTGTTLPSQMFTIYGVGFLSSPAGASTVSVTIRWTQNGQVGSATILSLTASTAGIGFSGIACAFPDQNTIIQYVTAWTPFGAGSPFYDFHLRVYTV